MIRPTLDPKHQALIEASAISPEVAAARGYWTARAKKPLLDLGFKSAQARVPALVVPIHDVHGEVALYQIRPDSPREKAGKELKYETPAGARMVLDVPPSVRPAVADPSVPLYITEGARKADSAVTAGLACVALLGVWNWRGSNDVGGKVALPCWESVALNGRTVFIAFDSDVMCKRQVAKALERLKSFLGGWGAKVKIIYFEPGADGAKVGFDDYLAAGHCTGDLTRLASDSVRRFSRDEKGRLVAAGPYRAKDGCLVHVKGTRDGPVESQLCNFIGRIAEEEVRDDGQEQTTQFRIEGWLASGQALPIATVPASQFPSLGWVAGQWGARAVVGAGFGAKDHTRAAIQRLSDPAKRHLYTHTGWRRIGDRWVYLHAGGGIDGDGEHEGCSVAVESSLDRFRLPVPAEGDTLKSAVGASLGLLEIGSDAVMVPLLCHTYRSVLRTSSHSLHLEGLTGRFKSVLAGLMQSHFGSSFTHENLPASWSSTDNYLESVAFSAKDVLLTIDDFAPEGTAADIQRLQRTAARIFRAQGNQSSRGRLNRNLSTRPTRPPRGSILSTGEDVPRGQSVRARILVVGIGPNDVNVKRLGNAQADAAGGRFAIAMAGFIRWLAPRLDEERKRTRQQALEWRSRTFEHRRHSEALGELAAGFRTFLHFAEACGCTTEPESEMLQQRVEKALLEVGRAQAQHQQSSDPVGRFQEILSGALASRSVHLVDGDGGPPKMAISWGWEEHEQGYRPRGKQIGWLVGDEVFLEPETAFAEAQRLAQSQGEGIAIASRTLWKRLDEKGLLVSKQKGRHTVQRALCGSRPRVLHLKAAFLSTVGGASGADGADTIEGDPTESSRQPGTAGGTAGATQTGAGKGAEERLSHAASAHGTGDTARTGSGAGEAA